MKIRVKKFEKKNEVVQNCYDKNRKKMNKGFEHLSQSVYIIIQVIKNKISEKIKF